jgi:hypothetical protein
MAARPGDSKCASTILSVGNAWLDINFVFSRYANGACVKVE